MAKKYDPARVEVTTTESVQDAKISSPCTLQAERRNTPTPVVSEEALQFNSVIFVWLSDEQSVNYCYL